jgi:hypothetical protein
MGRARSAGHHCPVPHDAHARCSAAHQIQAALEISGSTCFTRCLAQKALISPASQIGRHRAMAGLSTMTHATIHASQHTQLISSLVTNPLSEEKSVTEKWGKYDVLIKCAQRCGGIDVRVPVCRYANLARREVLFAADEVRAAKR